MATHGLSRVDYRYESVVEVPRAKAGTAEQWARAIFDDAPSGARTFLRVGWRFGLRIPLARPQTPGHVLGLPIEEATDTQVVLRSESKYGLHTRLVFEVGDEQVAFVTLCEYGNRAIGILWRALVAPIHQLTVPLLLRGAVRRRAAS